MNLDYKKNLVDQRRQQYKASSSRPIELFLQAYVDQLGSLDSLRHPANNQQVSQFYQYSPCTKKHPVWH